MNITVVTRPGQAQKWLPYGGHAGHSVASREGSPAQANTTMATMRRYVNTAECNEAHPIGVRGATGATLTAAPAVDFRCKPLLSATRPRSTPLQPFVSPLNASRQTTVSSMGNLTGRQTAAAAEHSKKVPTFGRFRLPQCLILL